MKSIMREIQSNELKIMEMDMLHEIDAICRKADIVYYAIGVERWHVHELHDM